MSSKTVRIVSYSSKNYFDKDQMVSILTSKCNEHGIEVEFTCVDEAISPENIWMVEGHDAISIFVHDKIDGDMLRKLESIGCKAIFCRCTGIDMISPEVENTKIKVYNSKSYSPASIAESALALSLLMIRSSGISIKNQCDNTFLVTKPLIGDIMSNMTVGVVGIGKIGFTYLDFVSSSITKSICYYDPYLKLNAEQIKSYEARGVHVKSAETLDELFSSCKIVSLHCQLTNENKNIINAKLINLMPNGSYIVNTARAGLLDSEAVYNALETGKLRAVGLDTIPNEELIFTNKFTAEEFQTKFPMEYKLASHPNVFITPHIAFLSKESLASILELSAQNIIDFINGESN